MLKVFSHKLFFILFFLGLCLIGPESYANPLDQISSKNVEKSLAPLQNIPEKELIAQLKDNTKNSHLAPLIEMFPTVTIFMVRLLKDREALPSLAKILENRDRLIKYAYWMLGTIVLGFVFKFIFKRDNAGLFESFLNYLFRFCLIMAIRIGVTYYFFAAELDPSIKVFSKTFL